MRGDGVSTAPRLSSSADPQARAEDPLCCVSVFKGMVRWVLGMRSTQTRLRLPEDDTASDHTNLLCSTAAAMKLAKSGCGSNGRDFSSG